MLPDLSTPTEWTCLVNQPLALRGVRVSRGPDLASGEQEKGAEGVIIDVDDNGATVLWDLSGERGSYRVGHKGKHDLQVVGSLSQLVTVLGKACTGTEPLSASFAHAGVRVVRGPDWKWGLQDGGGVGIVQGPSSMAGWVRVQWENSLQTADYRVGFEEFHDLFVAGPDVCASQVPQCTCEVEVELVLQVDEKFPHRCDECSAVIPICHPMRRCGLCDFDLCSACYLEKATCAPEEFAARPRRQRSIGDTEVQFDVSVQRPLGASESKQLVELARKERNHPQGVSVGYLHAIFKQLVKVRFPKHTTFASLGDHLWGKRKFRRKTPVDFLRHGTLIDPTDGVQGVSLCHAIGATNADADYTGDANLFVSWVWRFAPGVWATQ
mmetsp:Transcript_93480/g.250442  ORF Transcript_93480/g.250442 Transcript_93480/m.250442 type:complete len:381 (-) Transcript_93480:13-1155(-)